MRELEAFCCQHSCCADYGQRGAGNLRWHGWSGKKKQIRMLYCRTCTRYFSERKGSALWPSRLPEAQAVSVLEHLADGCGVRQTARLVKIHRNTVCRLNQQAGDHAARTHDEVGSLSPPRPKRFSLMRSGPLFTRKKNGAIPPAWRMSTEGKTGTMLPLIPSIVWSWKWSPVNGINDRRAR